MAEGLADRPLLPLCRRRPPAASAGGRSRRLTRVNDRCVVVCGGVQVTAFSCHPDCSPPHIIITLESGLISATRSGTRKESVCPATPPHHSAGAPDAPPRVDVDCTARSHSTRLRYGPSVAHPSAVGQQNALRYRLRLTNSRALYKSVLSNWLMRSGFENVFCVYQQSILKTFSTDGLVHFKSPEKLARSKTFLSAK